MRIQQLRHDNICILKLEGEVDLHCTPVLRAALDAKANAHCPALLLDVTDLTFIDSTGLGALIEYLRDSTSFRGRFCIGGVGPQLRSIFEIVRLDRAMPIFADAQKAREALLYDRLPSVSAPLFASAA